MQITNINSTQQRSFKSFTRTVYKAGKCATNDNILHRNNTWFFRNDLNWTKFAEFLKDKYKKIEHVNTYVYACSDGREAYSLLMALDTMLSEKEVEKFCPIKAKDYDLYAIMQAKTNILEIDETEKERINYITNGNFDKYFNKCSETDNKYKPKKILTDRIFFEVSDFTKEYQNLPEENSVLLIRNCWPYFSISNQYSLPRKICEHFKKNTTIVVGDFDYTTQEARDFMQKDFKPADFGTQINVFEK